MPNRNTMHEWHSLWTEGHKILEVCITVPFLLVFLVLTAIRPRPDRSSNDGCGKHHRVAMPLVNVNLRKLRDRK